MGQIIERTLRRVCFGVGEINEELETLSSLVDRLARIPDLPPAATACLMEISNVATAIDLEAGEIEDTITWYKTRIAAEGENHG